MNRGLKKKMAFLVAVMLVLLSVPALAANSSGYRQDAPYIIEPPVIPNAPTVQHDITTFLFLGVDHFVANYSGGMSKLDWESNHTDSIMLIAVDQTDHKVSLISFPRDTYTYAVGVQGVHKLNSVFNCAEGVEAGIQRTYDTITFLMGGIRPDHYMLVTPDFVRSVGDAMGGVDFDLEMSYKGSSGISYTKGSQHLNGQGIFDYARARTNATINADDYGRTQRQRKIMTALIQKLMQEPQLTNQILDVITSAYGTDFYTDMSLADMTALVPVLDAFQNGSVANYAMTGRLEMAMKFWHFSFLDQNLRQEIIQTVYGVKVEKLPYYTQGYANWLYTTGFEAVRVLHISEDAVQHAEQDGKASKQVAAVRAAQDELKKAFGEIGDDLNKSKINLMTKKQNALKTAVKALKDATGYPAKLSWKATLNWYQDPLINEYNEIDWR